MLGYPVALSWNVWLATPSVKVPLVTVVVVIWAASFTVRVKVWVLLLPTPLLAVTEMLMLPPAPVGGVPPSTPEEDKVSQLGKVVVVLKVGAGKPLALKVKLPAVPTVKVVALALVMAGGSPTVRVKFWVAALPTPLEAVMAIE